MLLYWGLAGIKRGKLFTISFSPNFYFCTAATFSQFFYIISCAHWTLSLCFLNPVFIGWTGHTFKWSTFIQIKSSLRFFFYGYFYYGISWHQEMNNDKEAKMPDISKTIANYHVSSGGYMLSKETSSYLIILMWMDGWIIYKFYWFSPKEEEQIFRQELNGWFLQCSLDVAMHFVPPATTVLISCNVQANWRAGGAQCWPAASRTALALPALPDYVPVDMEDKGGRLREGWDELQ